LARDGRHHGYPAQQRGVSDCPERAAWIGGHGTEPYEQNTQQSPGFGRSVAPQPAQVWKNRHASVGMSSDFSTAQCGQVMID